MIIQTLLRAFKPFQLATLVMTYLLGAGFVQYVREMRNWSVFIQGGIFLLLVALSLELLRSLQGLIDPQGWPEGITIREVKQIRLIIAMLAGTFLTVATSIFITWMQAGFIWQGLGFLLLAVMLLGVLYYFVRILESLRPMALLIEVLLFVVIPPALAYFLQSDQPHRLLTLVVIALVPGYLTNRLLFLLKHFARDYKYEVQTVVVQMGWEKTMVYHNALILLTYVLFALITLLGFPWFLIWPVFLTLPIGLVEIWLMERVKRGMKPLWQIMQFATACVLFIPLFLIAFAFWIR